MIFPEWFGVFLDYAPGIIIGLVVAWHLFVLAASFRRK
jgi:hypothetical protein